MKHKKEIWLLKTEEESLALKGLLNVYLLFFFLVEIIFITKNNFYCLIPPGIIKYSHST